VEAVNAVIQYIIPVFVCFTLLYGFARRVPIYDSFITGAKEGFGIILSIFPYVLAIFLMVKTFRASGALDFLQGAVGRLTQPLGIPPEVFSVALIKPFSNAATLSIFTDILKATGPDSQASTMAAVIMGSAETTFYVLAVYLGAVGIKKSGYLAPVCLLADAVGVIIAITIVRWLT